MNYCAFGSIWFFIGSFVLSYIVRIYPSDFLLQAFPIDCFMDYIVKNIIDQNKGNNFFAWENNFFLLSKKNLKPQFKKHIQFQNGAVIDFNKKEITVFDIYSLSHVSKAFNSLLKVKDNYDKILSLWFRVNGYKSDNNFWQVQKILSDRKNEINTKIKARFFQLIKRQPVPFTPAHFTQDFVGIKPQSADRNALSAIVKTFVINPFSKIFASVGTIYLNPRKETGQVIIFAEKNIIDLIFVSVHNNTVYICPVNPLWKIHSSCLSILVGIADYSKLSLAGSARYIFDPELQREKFSLELFGQLICHLKCTVNKLKITMGNNTRLSCVGKVKKSDFLMYHNASADISALISEHMLISHYGKSTFLK